MTDVNLQSLIMCIGLLFTTFSIVYAGREIRAARLVARGEFLLHLDELLQQHNDVHTRLRPGGEWASGRGGPKTPEEWVAVERYMGLFERIKVLVDSKILDIETVDQLYGYRVQNIVQNPIIKRAKLENESQSWTDFVSLQEALKKQSKSGRE